LHPYLGGAGARRLPVPMMNVINGIRLVGDDFSNRKLVDSPLRG
jgi:enolase